MRIAISGCTSSGKSTLIEAFRRRWPMYTTPVRTYRDMIKEMGLDHSSLSNDETQLLILDFMMQEHEKYKLGDKVIFDRCPLDNLVYTLQGNADNKISDEVAGATISFVRESLKNLDIIFWIKRDPNIKVVQEGLREVNLEFIAETDKIFGDLFHQYSENLESDIFFPKEDVPALLQMEGSTVDDRLAYIGEFIDYKGDLIETENSILDPSNIDLLQEMLEDQQKATINEDQMKRVMENFKVNKQ